MYGGGITPVSDRDTPLSHPGNSYELNVMLMVLYFKIGTHKITPKN